MYYLQKMKNLIYQKEVDRTVKQKTPEEKQKLLDHMKKMREMAKLKRTNPVEPVAQQVAQPTVQPAVQPAAQPTVRPTVRPVVQPVVQPVVRPNFDLLKRSMRRTIIRS